jgi:hypothetical protein
MPEARQVVFEQESLRFRPPFDRDVAEKQPTDIATQKAKLTPPTLWLYQPKEVLEIIDGLCFRSQNEKHELSHLYEANIKNMGVEKSTVT